MMLANQSLRFFTSILLLASSACASGGSSNLPSAGSSVTREPSSAVCEATQTGLEPIDSAELIELCLLVNQTRQAAGLQPLTLEARRSHVAQLHAGDMASQNFFSHNSLDGRTPFDRLTDAGIRYMTAGENIALGQSSAASVLNSWMRSEGHRANILNPQFKRLGLGADSQRWVQVFTD